jgi:ABC-type uncharacterized transport system substrate-binding protein
VKPVELGLVASHNRPGGNATGISLMTMGLDAKRFGLLRDLLPAATLIAVIADSNFPGFRKHLTDMQAAARTVGIEAPTLSAGSEGDFEPIFAALVQKRVGALLVGAYPFFTSHRKKLVALAARFALPTMYQLREFPLAGGLMSYGPSIPDVYRQAGVYAGRILKGEKPTDLPVVQPTKFELVLNLKTAKALGLNIPPTLLALADEVIE